MSGGAAAAVAAAAPSSSSAMKSANAHNTTSGPGHHGSDVGGASPLSVPGAVAAGQQLHGSCLPLPLPPPPRPAAAHHTSKHTPGPVHTCAGRLPLWRRYTMSTNLCHCKGRGEDGKARGHEGVQGAAPLAGVWGACKGCTVLPLPANTHACHDESSWLVEAFNHADEVGCGSQAPHGRRDEWGK